MPHSKPSEKVTTQTSPDRVPITCQIKYTKPSEHLIQIKYMANSKCISFTLKDTKEVQMVLGGNLHCQVSTKSVRTCWSISHLFGLKYA